MTHGASQPTLDGAQGPPPADGPDTLNLFEAAILLAFIRATEVRAPTTPSHTLTQSLARWLEQRGIIEVCPDDDMGPGGPPARAIYDPLSWRYSWGSVRVADLEGPVRARVQALSSERGNTETRAVLWRLLASAELEGYFANRLRKHGFDGRWADAVFVSHDPWRSERICLAQARYAAWAAVREGASAYLRFDGDEEGTRSAILGEFQRRLDWVEARPDWGTGFVPAEGGLQSVLLGIFLSDVARLGSKYWTLPPNARMLRSAEGGA